MLPLRYEVCGEVDDEQLSHLQALAAGEVLAGVTPWRDRLRRHGVAWVQAYAGPELVGFVNVAGDGGVHGFLLDTAVHPAHQHRGIGTALVQRAAAAARGAGCHWLHVDYLPHLEPFYAQACGFGPTSAGLLRLAP